ncbi:MAG: TIGR01212 family radical SAM protein [Candidatus Choladocola sp.]|nr:TIGR01212 family radical SAM protein [Candidatus Choladocola sp.]
MNWDGKPYHSLDYEMKHCYDEKVYRLSLNGGMTCPNRDGTIGHGGCIFCSSGGSGDFAASASLPIREQLKRQKEMIRQKRPVQKFIAYFQAYTNTYAPVDYLERIFLEAIGDPEVVILSVATRPDCLPDDVLALLSRLNQIKPVWIELGLQTVHEDTAHLIRRGYSLSCFDEAVRNLRRRNITVIVHCILGLPGETPFQMLETAEYLNHCDIQGIKLQLLHVLQNTDLADYYERTDFETLSMEAYIQILINCVEHLSPDIVIHRLTGDGPGALLIAPLWSSKKRTVLNRIHAAFRERGTWQGKYYLRGGINPCQNPSHCTN